MDLYTHRRDIKSSCLSTLMSCMYKQLPTCECYNASLSIYRYRNLLRVNLRVDILTYLVWKWLRFISHFVGIASRPLRTKFCIYTFPIHQYFQISCGLCESIDFAAINALLIVLCGYGFIMTLNEQRWSIPQCDV